jgi:threonine dehydratase
VIGVVPAAFPAMRAALDAGAIVPIEGRQTIADGLHGNIEPGSVTFELVREHVDEVVEVTEAEIESAMRWLAAERGVIAEGAGAAAVAALRAGKGSPDGNAVAVVSGRNVTLETIARVLAQSG